MKLVYTDNPDIEVSLGDRPVLSRNGEQVEVCDIRKPHKPSSTGRVVIMYDDGQYQEFFPSVIGAEWIEREDQSWNT